mmetsp:Transcript_37399/g.62961  ORF Transcript_37399/g.62961 Transcript_37399/m.62961 type:complete len:205 (-) Transcript_37399:677-1291(-)
MGISQFRTSSVVALRLTARVAGERRQNCTICGTSPDVDTVILLEDSASPRSLARMSTASITASTLCSGSPMPMNTTLVTLPMPSAAAMRFASTTCSTICSVVRFPRSPMRPVKQNWQFIAQPTWLEMHTVRRPLGAGIITASTIPPLPPEADSTSNSSLRVPSEATRVSRSCIRPPNSAIVASRSFQSLLTSCISSAPFAHLFS